MKCGLLATLIGVMLFHGAQTCACDPRPSAKNDAVAGKVGAPPALERDCGKLPETEAKALAVFARSLDKHGDVHVAAKAFAEKVKSLQVNGRGRLIAQISVEPAKREFTAGRAITFEVHTTFLPSGSAPYDWHWGAFEMSGTAPHCRVITSGGGSASGKTRLMVELTGPWQMSGDYELLFVVFGRGIPKGAFDFLDSARIRYTVKPAP